MLARAIIGTIICTTCFGSHSCECISPDYLLYGIHAVCLVLLSTSTHLLVGTNPFFICGSQTDMQDKTEILNPHDQTGFNQIQNAYNTLLGSCSRAVSITRMK